MRLLRFGGTFALCVLLLGCRAAAAAEDWKTPLPDKTTPSHQVVQMRLADEGNASATLGYGNCQWLAPLKAPPEKLLEEPEYKSDKPIYYAAHFGNGKNTVFTLVLDESKGPGKGYDTIYIDGNGDRRIDAAKEQFSIHIGDPAHSDSIRVRFQVTSGSVTAPYGVSLSAFKYSDAKSVVPSIHANLRDSSYYVGEAVFEANKCKIAVADLNCNGTFNDVEQDIFRGDRLFIDLNGKGGFKDGHGQQQDSFPYGGFTRIAGQWYSIVVSADGGRVEITKARPPLGKIAAPRQIAAARLNSATQPLDLEFGDGSASAVAGTYRVHRLSLLAERESPGGWTLSANFAGREPEVTIREGETTRLHAGLPLKVEPQVAADEDRTLRIGLRITGAGGEIYHWSPKERGSEASKAGYRILDPAGKEVASADFEFG
jgi:hypothetical protein